MRLPASILSSFILLLSLHLSAQTETNELKDFTEEKQAALDLSGKSSVQAPNTGIYMVPALKILKHIPKPTDLFTMAQQQ